MIKIVQIQSSSKSAGGSALKLHNAFLESDIDSYILTLHPDINDTERIIYPGKFSKIYAWLDDKYHMYLSGKSNSEFGLFSYPLIGTDVSKIDQIRKADIIYLHWVQGGFLTISGYRKLAKLGKPVVIFMHDMWSITGGCHYSFQCDKYKSQCNECQVFRKKKENDLSAKGFKNKLRLYSQFDNLYFVSPSKWLYECAKQSSLTREKPIFHIPNIVDESIFKPIDKKTAKRIFSFNEDECVIAFGAVSIDSPYKGWAFLHQALEILKDDPYFKKVSILVFGKRLSKKDALLMQFNTRFTGYLKDSYSTSLVYNAADVFVTPSLADNLPTTVLESQSCGTPVVGFDFGGIPDMIEHKKNGYVAKYRDSEDLAMGIKYCLENKLKGKLLPEFEKKRIIADHIRLIDSLK